MEENLNQYEVHLEAKKVVNVVASSEKEAEEIAAIMRRGDGISWKAVEVGKVVENLASLHH